MGKSYTLAELKAKAAEAQFIKTLPPSSKIRQDFYADIISKFVGSGPKGVYEALLEERRKERAMEEEHDKGGE